MSTLARMESLMVVSILVCVASLVPANDGQERGKSSSNPLNSQQASYYGPDVQWRKIHFNVNFGHRIPPFQLSIHHHGFQPAPYATPMPISETVPIAEEAGLNQDRYHRSNQTPTPHHLPPVHKVTSQTFQPEGSLPPSDKPVTSDPVFETSIGEPDPPLMTSEEPDHAEPDPPLMRLEEPDHAGEYKVVCYFTNWSWYRSGQGQYNFSDIDASLCTHIVYTFVVLDEESLLIESHDTNVDYDENFFEEVTALKSKDLKVLISIGGWRDSAGRKYTRLVQDPNRRRAFIEDAVRFIQDNNFDGLDIAWNNPVCWQNDCSRGPASDRANFVTFMKELKTAFEPHGLLLSSIISPRKEVIDNGFDVATLSKYVDWMALVSYDYYTYRDGKTGHVSPLYAHSQDRDTTKNINFTINHLLELGADPRKLVVGIPTYGQSYTLETSNDNTLNQKTSGPGARGLYTKLGGILAYYEICDKVTNDGWTVVRDQERSMGPYAYKGNQWVGYDDVDSVRYKTDYIKNLGLGGANVWSLDLDDFGKNCQCEEYPLLKTINRGLRNYEENDPGCEPLGGLSRRAMRTQGK